MVSTGVMGCLQFPTDHRGREEALHLPLCGTSCISHLEELETPQEPTTIDTQSEPQIIGIDLNTKRSMSTSLFDEKALWASERGIISSVNSAGGLSVVQCRECGGYRQFSVSLNHSNVAQLVARRAHNPEVTRSRRVVAILFMFYHQRRAPIWKFTSLF